MANEFIPFGVAGGANVLTNAEYSALPARLSGFVAGVAKSREANKAWRQSTSMAAMIGQVIDEAGFSALDDGNINNLQDAFERSLQTGRTTYVHTVGGTADAITAAFNPALTVYTPGMSVRFRVAATNTGPATLNADGLGALSIKTLRGDNLAAGDLPTGAVITLSLVSGAWMLTGVAYSDFRIVVRANLDFYVATTGSDSNDGSIGAPWLTLLKAWTFIRDRLDTNGKIVTVHVADGTYTQGLQATGSVLGGGVNFVGNVANPAACIIAPSGNASAFFAGFNAFYTVSGFTVKGNGSNLGNNEGCGLIAQSGDIQYTNVRFSNSTIAHVYAQSGVVQCLGGTNTILAGPDFALYAGPYGTIQLTGSAHTVSGTPAFTVFALASTGVIAAAGATITGTATGKRYQGDRSGVFVTNGAGASFFPGNVAGTIDSTSSYN